MLKAIDKRHAKLLLRLDVKLNLFDHIEIFVPLDKKQDVRLVVNEKRVFKIKGKSRQDIVDYLNR